MYVSLRYWEAICESQKPWSLVLWNVSTLGSIQIRMRTNLVVILERVASAVIIEDQVEVDSAPSTPSLTMAVMGRETFVYPSLADCPANGLFRPQLVHSKYIINCCDAVDTIMILQ